MRETRGFSGASKKVMSFLVGLAMLSSFLNPQVSGVRRFEVYHADPYVVVMLLMGQSPPYPEVSTLTGWISGMVSPSGEGTLTGVRGRFIVNPADNSIWFIPLRDGS